MRRFLTISIPSGYQPLRLPDDFVCRSFPAIKKAAAPMEQLKPGCAWDKSALRFWNGVPYPASGSGVTVAAHLTFLKKTAKRSGGEAYPFLGVPALFLCADCYTEIIMNVIKLMCIDSVLSTCCGMIRKSINMLWAAGEI